MWNADLARLSGALLFSLAVHALLLSWAAPPGQGPSRTLARKGVEVRLSARPVLSAMRQEQPAPVPSRPKSREMPPKPEIPRPLLPPPLPEPVPPVAVLVQEIPAAEVAEGSPQPEQAGEEEISADPVPSQASACDKGDQAGESGAGSPGAEGELVLARPLYRDNPVPVYPVLARRRQWQGTVVLEVLVKADGLVAELSVQQSSNHRVLDEAALAAVRNWRFTPGRQGRQPVAMKVLVPVRFGLE
jgi:protein TonB